MAEEKYVPYPEHLLFHENVQKKLMELEKRISDVEHSVGVLRVEDAKILERLDMMLKMMYEQREHMHRMEQEIKEIRSRPNRMWDGFVMSFVSAGVGGVVALLLRNILSK